MIGLAVGMGAGVVVVGIGMILLAFGIERDWRTYVVLGTGMGLGFIWLAA